MANAAVTFVYNEKVNLPIWIDYYGKQFGHENLFIIDRSSTDGSTDGLQHVNLMRIPRDEFDEDAKTNLMSSMHSALTSSYDAVIVTDCDEMLVPDPNLYGGLADYIEKFDGDYVNAMGIDVVHILSQERPLSADKPILSQRSVGRFHSPECKQLLSRSPTKWLPGLHSSSKKPAFDKNLILFHLKLMDYGHAVGRQAVNIDTKWSKASLAANYGEHHRWDLEHFVHEHFLVPMDLLRRGMVFDFEFDNELKKIEEETKQDAQGFYRIPMNVAKMVRIPDRFSSYL